MKLLLVRHAIAEEAEAFIGAGGFDAQRPLTEVGRKKMRKGANRLRSTAPRAARSRASRCSMGVSARRS